MGVCFQCSVLHIDLLISTPPVYQGVGSTLFFFFGILMWYLKGWSQSPGQFDALHKVPWSIYRDWQACWKRTCPGVWRLFCLWSPIIHDRPYENLSIHWRSRSTWAIIRIDSVHVQSSSNSSLSTHKLFTIQFDALGQISTNKNMDIQFWD